MKSRFIVLILILAFAAPTVLAQDDQQALVDRFILASQAADSYTSFVKTEHDEMVMSLNLELSGEVAAFENSTITDSLITQIGTGDERNIAAHITVEKTETTTQGENTQTETFTIEAEARLIDGTLYVLMISENTLLPDDWFVVDDLANYPALEDLDLDNLLEDKGFFDEVSEDEFRQTISEAEVAPDTLEDGTAVDAITLRMQQEGVLSLLNLDEELDPSMLALFGGAGQAGEDDFLSMTAFVDEADLLHTGVIQWEYSLVDADGATVMPDQLPAGSTLDFAISASMSTAYSQINEELEPALVPETLAQ
jgi:hypothetical protein